LPKFLKTLDFTWDLRANRKCAFDRQRENRERFQKWLVSEETTDNELSGLGIFRSRRDDLIIDGVRGSLHAPEVHSIRPARRIGPDGQMISDIVIEITQSWYPSDTNSFAPILRGGVTLLADLETGRIRYTVRKRVAAPSRYSAQRVFSAALTQSSLRGNYGASFHGDEPLALAHRAAMGTTDRETTGKIDGKSNGKPNGKPNGKTEEKPSEKGALHA